MDIFSGTLVVGGALALAAVTVGPFYFLFEVLPNMAEQTRKEHFLQLRRAKRKERNASRKAGTHSLQQGLLHRST